MVCAAVCPLVPMRSGPLWVRTHVGGRLCAARHCEAARTGGSGATDRNEEHMANPFEDPDASYRVLVNHEGQHSLWPASLPTPDGWTVVHDTDSRASCLEYIEENWTDMWPKSHRRARQLMAALAGNRRSCRGNGIDRREPLPAFSIVREEKGRRGNLAWGESLLSTGNEASVTSTAKIPDGLMAEVAAVPGRDLGLGRT